MKAELDENLPSELLEDLRALGHEADTLQDEALRGATDAHVLDRIRRDGRVLVTPDKGIADIRAHPPEQYPWIVLFRPGSLGRGTTLAFVRRHLRPVFKRNLTGRPVVVSESGIRTR